MNLVQSGRRNAHCRPTSAPFERSSSVEKLFSHTGRATALNKKMRSRKQEPVKVTQSTWTEINKKHVKLSYFGSPWKPFAKDTGNKNPSCEEAKKLRPFKPVPTNFYCRTLLQYGVPGNWQSEGGISWITHSQNCNALSLWTSEEEQFKEADDFPHPSVHGKSGKLEKLWRKYVAAKLMIIAGEYMLYMMLVIKMEKPIPLRTGAALPMAAGPVSPVCWPSATSRRTSGKPTKMVHTSHMIRKTPGMFVLRRAYCTRWQSNLLHSWTPNRET